MERVTNNPFDFPEEIATVWPYPVEAAPVTIAEAAAALSKRMWVEA
jgi:hypothetical protein